VYCIKFSASGPKISNFLSGERSVAIALSRQALYSFIVPELVKLFANQKPLYSAKFLVSSAVFYENLFLELVLVLSLFHSKCNCF